MYFTFDLREGILCAAKYIQEEVAEWLTISPGAKWNARSAARKGGG